MSIEAATILIGSAAIVIGVVSVVVARRSLPKPEEWTVGGGVKVVLQDGGPHMEERVVPLVVEPPDDWPVYALTDRKEPS